MPGSDASAARINWRLDERGLEWTTVNGSDHWMPFACVRLATMGDLGTRGWRLRLSGPPGAALICSGMQPPSQDLDTFSRLASAMILGAQQAGCRAKFRLNHRPTRPGWLWARGGKPLESGSDLVSVLPHIA